MDDIAVVATYDPRVVMGYSHRIVGDRIVAALREAGEVNLRLCSWLDKDIPEKNVLFVGTFTQNVLGSMSRFVNKKHLVFYATVEGIPMIPPHVAERRVAARCTIVPVSGFVKTMIEAAGMPQLQEPFNVEKPVPHGVNMQATSVDEDYLKWLGEWSGDSPLILTVQSMTQGVDRKGILNFLVAAAAIRRDRPDVKFIVHSGGSENIDVRQMSRLLGIEKSLWFTNSFGLYSDEMMNSLYHAATGYACTSLIEGFGMPMIEAYRMSLPVVAIDAQPFNEIVKHGVTGLLAPVLDIAQVPWMDQMMMMLHRYDTSVYASRLHSLLEDDVNKRLRRNITAMRMTYDARRNYGALLKYFE